MKAHRLFHYVCACGILHHRKGLNFESLCCNPEEWVKTGWPVRESLIHMDFYWERIKKKLNFILMHVNVTLNCKCMPGLCCTHSRIFCQSFPFVLPQFKRHQALYKSFYVGFVSSLQRVFLKFFIWISISGDAASSENSKTLSYESYEQRIKLGLWRHSSVFNFSLSSCLMLI